MYCTNCGEHVEGQMAFCSKCGAAMQGPELKSRLIAGILGIFLGGLGIHRFYLGYTTIGVIQIVVTIFTCGLGALWGFIEGILILVGNMNNDFDGRPLKE